MTGVVVLAVQSRILSALFIKQNVELFRFSGMLYMYQFPTDIQIFNFNTSCVSHCLEINALLIVPKSLNHSLTVHCRETSFFKPLN